MVVSENKSKEENRLVRGSEKKLRDFERFIFG